MASRWMQEKVLKVRKAAMIDQRGPYKMRSATEAPQAHTPRIAPSDGWYCVDLTRKTPRGLPISYGPFATHEEARGYAVAWFGTDKFRTYQRDNANKPAPSNVLGSDDVAAMVDEYHAKRAYQRATSLAVRQALGKRTSWK